MTIAIAALILQALNFLIVLAAIVGAWFKFATKDTDARIKELGERVTKCEQNVQASLQQGSNIESQLSAMSAAINDRHHLCLLNANDRRHEKGLALVPPLSDVKIGQDFTTVVAK